MQQYENADSGVAEFEILPREIHLRFHNDRRVYVYDYDHPGPEHVEQMKRLARAGRGLSSYVSRYVRGNYADRIDESAWSSSVS
jgi:hypothetical protein